MRSKSLQGFGAGRVHAACGPVSWDDFRGVRCDAALHVASGMEGIGAARRGWRGRLACAGFACALLAGGAALVPAPAQATQITGAGASSTLVEEGFDHGAANVLVDNDELAWAEGAQGAGVGEWLELSYDQRCYVSALTIKPGFLKSEDLFYANAAPKRILVQGDNASAELDLSAYVDDYNACKQGITFTFDDPIWCSGSLRVTILEVREGTSWEDAVITGLSTATTDVIENGMTGWTVYLDSQTQDALVGVVKALYSSIAAAGAPEGSVEVSAEGLGGADMASMLAAYIRANGADPRISRDGQGACTLSETDARTLAGELFGASRADEAFAGLLGMEGVSERDATITLAAAQPHYTETTLTFGSATSMWTDEGSLHLEGALGLYAYDSATFTQTGTWHAVFKLTSGSEQTGNAHGTDYAGQGLPYEFSWLGVAPVGQTVEAPQTGGISEASASSDVSGTAGKLQALAWEYLAAKNGTGPQCVDVEYDEQSGTYAVHAYDMVGGHSATYDWYYVNAEGVGTNILGESVDLRSRG